MDLNRLALGVLSIALLDLRMAVVASAAMEPAAIEIAFDAPGAAIPSDFAGLSFETKRMLAQPYGSSPSPTTEATPPRLFSADDKPLVQFIHTLGVHSIRVGGNTADRPAVPMPTHDDIDALFKFAKAADVKIIYTLRLHDTTPAQDAAEAKYIIDHYKSQCSCFELGNETESYLKTYANYLVQFKAVVAAVSAIAPSATFCGPSATRNTADWSAHLAGDLGSERAKLQFISQHDYPCGDGRKNTDPAKAIESMLAPARMANYEKLYNLCVLPANAQGVHFRLEETNSFSNGGAPNASNTFADALWALDYMHWWAMHGTAGLNFHTSDLFPITPDHKATWYVAFAATPGRTGYSPKPLAYALTAFEMTAPARSVPVTIKNTSNVNLTAYATLTADAQLCLTLINKSNGSSAVSAHIQLPSKWHAISQLTLAAHQLDSTDDITLGGSKIDDAGNWRGGFEPLGQGALLLVPPSSALVIRLKSNDGP